MRIALLGTGRMARQLGAGWAQAGHEIFFGSRNPEAKPELIEEVANAQLMSIEEALAAADVVVIALPYAAVAPLARQYAGVLREKLIIDITNPFKDPPEGGPAGAEVTAEAIGPGARVVAAFKDNFSDTLLEPVDPHYGLVRDVHFAGDNDEDKAIVTRLVESLGFRPVDCGPLYRARVLEAMVPLIVALDRHYTNGERRASWRMLA